MASLTLKNIHKSFGHTAVLSGIDLEVADGEFAVIVGPSGCGKSTLLRTIAGLEDIDEGTIRIGEMDVTTLPPSKRGIAMVFQSYALYPHMTVYENMSFGMKIAGASAKEIDRAVRAAAETLGLTALLNRKPKELSGGQRQRTAIGRATVRRPKIFLFDEPLSNLDASLRVKMRQEFARLHETIETTMIYVTHDQVEAMTLADRIVVLRDGQVEQIGFAQRTVQVSCQSLCGRLYRITGHELPGRVGDRKSSGYHHGPARTRHEDPGECRFRSVAPGFSGHAWHSSGASDDGGRSQSRRDQGHTCGTTGQPFLCLSGHAGC